MAAQPAWVATAIPAFVVGTQQWREYFYTPHGCEQIGPDVRMLVDYFPFGSGQRARLMQNGIGNTDFTQIMQPMFPAQYT